MRTIDPGGVGTRQSWGSLLRSHLNQRCLVIAGTVCLMYVPLLGQDLVRNSASIRLNWAAFALCIQSLADSGNTYPGAGVSS